MKKSENRWSKIKITKKIYRLVLLCVSVTAIAIFLSFIAKKDAISGITSIGAILLLNILSILQTKVVAKSGGQEKEIDKATTISFTREFQPPPQLGLIIWIILLTAAIIWNWNENNPMSTKILSTFIGGGLIILTLTSLARQKIIFSNEGIKYFNEFGRAEFSWENVAEIVKTGLGIELLIVKHVRYYSLWTGKISDFEIPLSTFNKDWKNTEIGELIKENTNLEFL